MKLKFVLVFIVVTLFFSISTVYADGFGGGSRGGHFGSGGFGGNMGYTVISYEALCDLCVAVNDGLGQGLFNNTYPFSDGAGKWCTVREITDSTAIEWNGAIYSSYFVISTRYLGVYYNFVNASGGAFIAFSNEEDFGGFRLLYQKVSSIDSYSLAIRDYVNLIVNKLDDIRRYTDGIEGKLDTLATQLDQLHADLGLMYSSMIGSNSTLARAHDQITQMGNIAANYTGSTEQNNLIDIAFNESWNGSARAVYVTYEDLTDIVSRLNLAGYACTISQHATSHLYYVAASGTWIVNPTTRVGIGYSTGLGAFTVSNSMVLVSSNNGITAALTGLSQKADTIISALSNIGTMITNSNTYLANLVTFVQGISGKLDLMLNGNLNVNVNLDNQFYDVNNNLEAIFNRVDLTGIEDALARIEDAIEHVTCHHDYRSMLYLDGVSVTFEGIKEEPVQDLTISINAMQDLNGYDRAWAGGSRKNLYDETQWAGLGIDQMNYGISIDSLCDRINALPVGTYTISFKAQVTSIDTSDSGRRRYGLYLFNSSGNHYGFSYDWTPAVGNTYTCTVPLEITEARQGNYSDIHFQCGRENCSDTCRIYNIQLENGSVATSYEPYENLAPISGWTGAQISNNGVAQSVSWADTAGTVYGGTLNVTTGELTVTKRYVRLYGTEDGYEYAGSDTSVIRLNLNTAGLGGVANYAPSNTRNALCNAFRVTSYERRLYFNDMTMTIEELKAYLQGHETYVVYDLATPVTYQLDPLEIYSVVGTNEITANCGGVSLQVLDGTNLTDMGYTLIVCQKCGQVQPMFDYTRLLDRLDILNLNFADHASSTDAKLGTIIDLLQENLTNTDTQSHEHTYTRHITQDATCTVPGLATYTCDECGYGYTELLPALGHDWDFTEHVDAVLDENNEVLQPAYDVYTCTRCDHTYLDYDGTGAPEGGGQVGDLLISIFSRLGNLVGDLLSGLLSLGDRLLTGLDDLATDFNDRVHQVESFGGDYPQWLSGFWDAIPSDLQVALSFCLIVALVGVVGKKLVFTS